MCRLRKGGDPSNISGCPRVNLGGLHVHHRDSQGRRSQIIPEPIVNLRPDLNPGQFPLNKFSEVGVYLAIVFCLMIPAELRWLSTLFPFRREIYTDLKFSAQDTHSTAWHFLATAGQENGNELRFWCSLLTTLMVQE